MEEKVFFEGGLGKVCGVYSKLGDEVVILIHGFSSHKDTSAKVNARALEEIGISTLRIDLDNQGESELDFKENVSIPNYIKQVEAAMNFVKKQGHTQISLLGTSFGGIVALAVAHKYPEIKRLFLRSSVVDWKSHAEKKYGNKLKEFARTGRIVRRKKNETEYAFTYECYATAEDYVIPNFAEEIKMPIQFVHGTADQSIDYNVILDAAKKFPNASVYLVEGGNHFLEVDGDFSESEEVMVDFFSKEV